ncbi:Alpha/Beta hydrolase protein [Aspergillus californicus]
MGLKSPIPLEQLQFNVPVPYKLHVDRELLDITKQKLALDRFPEEQSDFGERNWAQGATYDWDTQEKTLNDAFNHFIVKLDVPGYGTLVLHYTHNPHLQQQRNPSPPLSQPKDTKDPAFHVVAPSIPGFGFSPAPTKSGVGPNVVARTYKILMTEVLRYPRFVTQGGDFGSFITRSLAIKYPEIVRAQHLNMFPLPPPTLFSAPAAYLRWCFSALTCSTFEQKALQVRWNFEQDQTGYLEQQKTRPQTLGFALGDSSVGLLAWFVEKVHDWAEVYDGFSDEDLITLAVMH